jgi:mannose-1-phosphate guanylyltransferase
VLVKRVTASKASTCGEVVADPVTHELLHYTERPETCGAAAWRWVCAR